MNFFKRFWILTAAVALAIALPYSVRAQYTGLEGQVSFYETVDGHFSPGMKLQTAMYASGFGMGFFYGENKSAGPCFIWRAMQYDFSPSFYLAANLGAASDLWQGYRDPGEVDQTNGTGYFEPRIGWKYLNGNVEIGFPIQCLMMSAAEKEWTFGVTIAFMPSQLFAKPQAPAPSASIDSDRGYQLLWKNARPADEIMVGKVEDTAGYYTLYTGSSKTPDGIDHTVPVYWEWSTWQQTPPPHCKPGSGALCPHTFTVDEIGPAEIK